MRMMRISELPIGVTDDRVVGSINVELTLKDGRIHFEPGLLAREKAIMGRSLVHLWEK